MTFGRPNDLRSIVRLALLGAMSRDARRSVDPLGGMTAVFLL